MIDNSYSKHIHSLWNYLFYTLFIVFYQSNLVTSIACYSCVSTNGSNLACEDPIDANVPIQRQCQQTLPGHNGLFYAYYCTKIKGVRQKDGVNLLIRRCSMDKLSDIPTHCGQFQLDDDLFYGCIATCARDWCNAGSSVKMYTELLFLCLVLRTLCFNTID